MPSKEDELSIARIISRPELYHEVAAGASIVSVGRKPVKCEVVWLSVVRTSILRFGIYRAPQRRRLPILWSSCSQTFSWKCSLIAALMNKTSERFSGWLLAQSRQRVIPADVTSNLLKYSLSLPWEKHRLLYVGEKCGGKDYVLIPFTTICLAL